MTYKTIPILQYFFISLWISSDRIQYLNTNLNQNVYYNEQYDYILLFNQLFTGSLRDGPRKSGELRVEFENHSQLHVHARNKQRNWIC